jgi:hypothetical protein
MGYNTHARLIMKETITHHAWIKGKKNESEITSFDFPQR